VRNYEVAAFENITMLQARNRHEARMLNMLYGLLRPIMHWILFTSVEKAWSRDAWQQVVRRWPSENILVDHGESIVVEESRTKSSPSHRFFSSADNVRPRVFSMKETTASGPSWAPRRSIMLIPARNYFSASEMGG